MKKIFVLMLVLVLAMGICSAQAAAAYTVNNGILGFSAVTEDEFETVFLEHFALHHPSKLEFGYVFYDNMTSMLMALRSGDIFMMTVGGSVADYMVARNDSLIVMPHLDGEGLASNSADYTMMLRGDSAELHAKLNDAIIEIKNDGTMDALIENSLKSFIAEGEPEAAALPVIEGAPTITVAVTGDLPPMDFVAVDGTPAGFNVAFLTEISRRANLNIKIVIVDAAARLAALSSGRADVVFWSRINDCEQHPGYDAGADAPVGVLVTEPYFTDSVSFVLLKDNLRYLGTDQ